jgi:hypothetical protein
VPIFTKFGVLIKCTLMIQLWQAQSMSRHYRNLYSATGCYGTTLYIIGLILKMARLIFTKSGGLIKCNVTSHLALCLAPHLELCLTHHLMLHLAPHHMLRLVLQLVWRHT